MWWRAKGSVLKGAEVSIHRGGGGDGAEGSVSTGEGGDGAGSVPTGAEGSVLTGEGGDRAGGSVPTGEAKGVMEQKEAYLMEGEAAE